MIVARPAEFDREIVLREAMAVFWRQGYNSTSIKDIVDATEIQSGSIYWAFGNKQKLFLEVIEHYCCDIQKIIDRTLKTSGSPLGRIKKFFQGLAQHTLNNEDKNGCLLVNTLLEVSKQNQEIRDSVRRMFEHIEAELCLVIAESQICGEIADNRKPQILAKLFVTLIYGLRIYGKGHNDRQALGDIVEEFMAAIGTNIK